MRWPWIRYGTSRDREGKELAKRQHEVAKAIHAESVETAHESRYLLYKNHFGHNLLKAMRGN